MGAHDIQDYQYSELAWSPKQGNIIVGMRADPDFPSHILWLAEPDSLAGPTIAGEPDNVYLFPRWDPWGISLVFSQLNLKAKYQPEIAIWKPGFEHPLVIANGTNPHWLP